MRFLNQIRWLFFTKHPQINLQTDCERWSPNTQQLTPFVDVFISSEISGRVGHLTYLLSPLNDRLYLYEIQISESFRKNGYATSALKALSQRHNGIPISPVKILNTPPARGFWGSMYKRSCFLFPIMESISVGDWITEADRWRHLHFAADCLIDYRQRHYDEFERLLASPTDEANRAA